MKKILSAFMIAVSLSLPFCGVLAADNEGLTDKQAEAIALLNDLEILPTVRDGEALDTVSRAELAKVLVKVMGGEDLPSEPSRIFGDVLPDNDAAASIEYLYNRGIMTGHGDAIFGPEEPVTLGQLVKVMVTITGYANTAEIMGGYPNGYYSSAIASDLLSGVSGTTEKIVTFADIAVMIQNTLECRNFIVMGGIKNGYVSEEKVTDQEYMSYTLDIYKYTGIVEAVGESSLADSAAGYRKDQCMIGGELMEAGDMDLSPYLGMKVKVYYKQEFDNSFVKHVIVDRNNTVIDVEAKDISDKTDKSVFQYYEGSKSKRANISSNAIFMLNGKRLGVVSDDDLVPDNGSVRLISNDGDSTYDVIIIQSYDTFIVDKTLASDSMVYFKYGRGSIDLEEGNGYKTKYYLDGEETDFSGISSDSVLSIAFSRNLTGDVLAEIYISNEKLTGRPASVNYGDDRYSMTMPDGGRYYFTAEFERRLKEGQASTYEPMLDTDGTFYIDYFGQLAAYTVETGSKNYGYVVKCYYDADEEFGEIKLFSKEGQFETFALADKITLNDDKVSKSEVPDAIMETGNDNKVYQLIVYTSNEKGEITKIQTAKDKTADSYYITSENEFVLNAHPRKATGEDASLRFYKNMAENKPFNFEPGKTIQFMIPTDRTNENQYKIATKLSSTDVTLPAPLYIYDAGPGGVVGAIVSNSASEGEYSDASIVDKVTEAVDEEDNAGTLITFVNGTSVFVDENVIYDQPALSDSKGNNDWSKRIDYSDVTAEDLKRGDVIEYTTANGKADMIRVLVKVDNIGPVRADGDHIALNGNMVARVISMADNGKVALVYYVDRFGQEQYQTMHVNSSVYRYNSDTKKVNISAPSDIQEGDTILINSYWWSPKMVVIFR